MPVAPLLRFPPKEQSRAYAIPGGPGLRGAPLEENLSGDRAERRLAAILAADVAGYSRLMGADEEGTLERLKAHRSGLVERSRSTAVAS
jgi:class 3 adenylate cyclase